jgi:UDP-GlcNAc3NAcA epimerase
MSSAISILTVVGARPQFVKAAPVSAALQRAGGFHEILIHTGQHFDAGMSDVFFDQLGLAPPFLNMGIHGGGHGAMTGRMLEGLEQIIGEQRPDVVLVYGDTNSTLAGALAAAKLHVPVAHVEAGLRSYNKRMPEEINRVITDHLSSVLFCPTQSAVTNLRTEGIVAGVHAIGDVMFDACLAARARHGRADVVRRLGLQPGQFAVATIHRAENVDDRQRLAEIISYLRAEASTQRVVFPMHPRTRLAIEAHRIAVEPLQLCEPLGYLEMNALLAACAMVFTDSGGVQKEAYFHRKPCVTLRDETEWVETVECGWNRLWRGPDYRPRREIAEYGDGHASERIADILRASHVSAR